MSKVMHLETLRIHLPNSFDPEREVDRTFCLIRFTNPKSNIASMLRSIARRKLRRPSSQEAHEYFRLRPDFTKERFVVALMERVEILEDGETFFLIRTCYVNEQTGELCKTQHGFEIRFDPLPVYLLAVLPKAR